ncbi:MAG: hypothetical protein ACYDDE_00535 [bacterium]
MKYLYFQLKTSANTGNNSGKWSGYSKKHGKIIKLSESDFKKFKNTVQNKYFWSHRFSDGWLISFSLNIIDSYKANKIKKTLDGVCGYENIVNEIIKTGEIKSLN